MVDINLLTSALGAAAVVPAFLYLWAIASLHRKRQSPWGVLVTFLLGGLSIYILHHIRPPFEHAVHLLEYPHLSMLINSIVGIAAPEEAAKLIILLIFSSRYFVRGYLMRGVLYGAAVGLGFAAAENLWYLANFGEVWRTYMIGRNIVTVPVHASLGIVSGVFVARANAEDLFTRNYPATSGAVLYLLAWLVPTLLHGIYNYPHMLLHDEFHALLIQEPELATPLYILEVIIEIFIILIAAGIIYRLIKRQRRVKVPPKSQKPHYPWHLDLLGTAAGLTGGLMVVAELLALFEHRSFQFDRYIVILLGAALLWGALTFYRAAAARRRVTRARTAAD